jgi:hypothetical protein
MKFDTVILRFQKEQNDRVGGIRTHQIVGLMIFPRGLPVSGESAFVHYTGCSR